MKIAIDCRYIGMSGIGRVCEGILDALDFSAHSFFLIGKREKLQKYPAEIVEDSTNPYSFGGLRSFPKKLNKTCDALLVPNFLIPFGVKIPVLTVMHDLAFLDVKETTRGFKDKLIKKILLKRCMKKSKSVACVSRFTLERCERYYGKLAGKCFVNYNGISENVFAYANTHERAEKEDQIVFVGNVKPHKGLTTLLSAFSELGGDTELKIIGEKDTFLTGLQLDENAYKNVVFTGKLSDKSLFFEIARSKYLVLPSKYEGFGLPPLEALVLGTQPIVSDIPVFREVYAGLPVKFFGSEEELVALLREPPQTVDCAREIMERYSFQKQAKTLLERIEGIL